MIASHAVLAQKAAPLALSAKATASMLSMLTLALIAVLVQANARSALLSRAEFKKV